MRKGNLWGKILVLCFFIGLIIGLAACGGEKEADQTQAAADIGTESEAERDARMAWWREARFGLFIHWGLYAIPAGEWQGETTHAEWILTTAQIPVKQYEEFAPQFNPVKFDAAAWVRMAKEAGMKYIVITSKHHDGFCLFDSRLTDYDVMDATPFKRDIMQELADECREQGLKICWYHSIMDWHHPDYLPRRNWEKRSSEGADLDRYVEYMKGQVKELVSNYGPIGVLWFDGEWESTWNRERGSDLYRYVRGLQPDIIINNRVSSGRAGMAGTYDPQAFAGDFGTPEQQIPATGLGYDWETCMTMNDHWGYNKHDNNWKSTEDLVRKLVDIASKGGNFLLNVGPTAEGLFPQPSIERLAAIGKWMKTNGESIYGTSASKFEKLDWGRCTVKPQKLYLHVFDWPQDGQLVVPGLVSQAEAAYLLTDPGAALEVVYNPGAAILNLPQAAPDPIDSVVVLEFQEEPEVVNSPRIVADIDIFIDQHEVRIKGGSETKGVEIRYTLDGSQPVAASPLYKDTEPIILSDTAMVRCRFFRAGEAISPISIRRFRKVTPRPASPQENLSPGVHYDYFQGKWEKLPDFSALKAVVSGQTAAFDISPRLQPEDFAFRFTGFIMVPKVGVYTFYLVSDDGSRFLIGDKVVIDNDGLHSPKEMIGRMALSAGLHPFSAEFFQRSGGVEFILEYSGPGIKRQVIPSTSLFYTQ